MKKAWICLTVACTFAAPAWAKLHEDQIDVPVSVTDGYGKKVEQPIKVTIFWDDTNPKPAPVLVLNHGRASDAEGRAAVGRSRFGEVSKFFVSQGFIVAVPTRIGYGVTGGEDVENSGTCGHKNYPPVLRAAADQALAVLDVVRERPDADKGRSVIVGQSVGGATSVAIAARNPPGVVASINFAGGAGGNPKTDPKKPCAPQALERLFNDYGKTARIPMLWIYAENDMYFGAELPREWFKAFKGAGGTGDFVQFPPRGDDGHLFFTKFPTEWQPKVKEFLKPLGVGKN